MENLSQNENNDAALLDLSKSQIELDNITEYNTQFNRCISEEDDNMRNVTYALLHLKVQKQALKCANRKRRDIVFKDAPVVINSEDVDPNVGRSVTESTVVPAKRSRHNTQSINSESALGVINASVVQKQAVAADKAPRFDGPHAVDDMSNGPQKKKYAKEVWPRRRLSMPEL